MFAEPGFRPRYKASLTAAIAEGVEGIVSDQVTIGSERGFDLREMKTLVHLWHGNADANITPMMGRYLAKQLHNCDVQFIDYAGHFLLYGNADLILRDSLRSR